MFFSMNSSHEGPFFFGCGVRVANDVEFLGFSRTDGAPAGTSLVCMGFPAETPMDRRSCGLSHPICFDGVDNIRAMIADGTPSSLSKRAINRDGSPAASLS